MRIECLARRITDGGARVWLDGESIHIRGGRPLANALIEQLRRNKLEVIEALRRLPVCAECGAAISPDEPEAWWGLNRVHLDCGKAAWQRVWKNEDQTAEKARLAS
jgi:hypothetical protein